MCRSYHKLTGATGRGLPGTGGEKFKKELKRKTLALSNFKLQDVDLEAFQAQEDKRKAEEDQPETDGAIRLTVVKEGN